ncbi:MAG: TonB-dependent receptor [Chitinophagales bacterium]
MQFRLLTIIGMTLGSLHLMAQEGDVYSAPDFKPNYMKACTEGIQQSGAPLNAEGYCNCVYEKLKAQHVPVADMGNLADSNSALYQSIIKPCTQEHSTENVEKTAPAEAAAQNLQLDNIPTISVSDEESGDASSDQNVSSMLSASRDVFASAASFRLAQGGFRLRGLSNDHFATLLNGVYVNDADNGEVFWGAWGGLNDVWFNRDNSYGMAASVNAFGNTGGVYAIDTRAGHQRKGLKISYTATNRNYRNRLMATYNTGYLKGGWALSASFSRRWAKEGYQPGTFYDGYAYFLSVEKSFQNKHWLSLTVFGTPTRNGRAGAAVSEMQNLAGTHYYNPYWGYQNGVKRNADEIRRHEPTFILTHEAKFSSKTSLLTGVGFSFGKTSRSDLGWYNAQNPAPDYYRNLPSFADDAETQQQLATYLRYNEAARQLNWDNLYDINRHSLDTIRNADGISGKTVTGNRARYFVSDRVEDTKKFNFNTTFNHSFNNHVSLTAGLTYQYERTRHYRQMRDLLGADYYVDLNQFAERSFPSSPELAQNNAETQNRIIKVGDEFAYNFYQTTHRTSGFIQPYFRFKHIDFFAGVQLTHNYFWRTGVYQNGLFLNNSKGDSKKLSYFNYGIKVGVTGKINGRNYIYANAMVGTQAPQFKNSFLSASIRNDIVPNLKNEQYYAAELGYNFTSPKYKVKVTGFFVQRENETENYRFFHDDYFNFVNYAVTGIATRHYGVEIGADVKIWKGLSVDAAASIGRYQYITNGTANTTIDNTAEVVNANQTVYLKGFNVARTPQMAMTYGVRYQGKDWRVGVNFNYFDWMWVQVNPIRRTSYAIDLVEKGSTLYHQIWDQERLKGQFTMDLNAGYTWNIDRTFSEVYRKTHKHFALAFTASVNNMTNNQNLVVAGNEQLRFDYTEKDPNKFATKYRYMQGVGFFVTVQFRMN